jgi:hypothetical protein
MSTSVDRSETSMHLLLAAHKHYWRTTTSDDNDFHQTGRFLVRVQTGELLPAKTPRSSGLAVANLYETPAIFVASPSSSARNADSRAVSGQVRRCRRRAGGDLRSLLASGAASVLLVDVLVGSFQDLGLPVPRVPAQAEVAELRLLGLNESRSRHTKLGNYARLVAWMRALPTCPSLWWRLEPTITSRSPCAPQQVAEMARGGE